MAGENPIEVKSPPYREGTRVAPTLISLAFNAGGIGDYIHWVGAIKYAIDKNEHLHGHILAPEYFFELADLWLGKYSPRFSVVSYENLGGENPYIKDRPAIVPNGQQFANACGFHLTRLGFIYFMQKDVVPGDYDVLPEIRGDEVDVSHFGLPENYVVIPTEATAENRMLPAETINSLTKHILNRGYTPVFLGKEKLAEDYGTKSSAGIKTRGVLDLRNKTNLIEAAVIMARAKFVLGVDGGLLHLAACSNVPVAFIFTTVHPDYRVPKRRPELSTTVIVPPKTLTCRFCNSGDPKGEAMTYIIGHDFKNCLYRDNLCTKLIDARTLITVVDQLLENKNGT